MSSAEWLRQQEEEAVHLIGSYLVDCQNKYKYLLED